MVRSDIHADYDMRRQVLHKLVAAMGAGDLHEIKNTFSRLTDEERHNALMASTPGCVVIQRPSSNSDVAVKCPSLLMLAVCEGLADAVTYLAEYRVRLVWA